MYFGRMNNISQNFCNHHLMICLRYQFIKDSYSWDQVVYIHVPFSNFLGLYFGRINNTSQKFYNYDLMISLRFQFIKDWEYVSLSKFLGLYFWRINNTSQNFYNHDLMICLRFQFIKASYSWEQVVYIHVSFSNFL